MNFTLFAHADYIFTHAEHIIAHAEYMFALGEQRIDNVYKQKTQRILDKIRCAFQVTFLQKYFVKSNDSLQYPGI